MGDTPLVGNIKDLTASATTAANAARKTDSTLGKDAFLSLLVTQLKNQDPMKPMEDSQFIGQMAQFSSLEQMQNLNKTMEAQAKFQGLSNASGLIGKSVTLVDKEGTVTGVVSEVRQKDDKLNVVINGKEYDSTTITGVTSAPAAASGTTPTK